MLLLTTALVACGGSGGGGSDTIDPVDPPVNPDQTFSLSGNISGLTGTVQIANGFQTQDISTDGAFAFTHQYRKGDTFAITVDTGATEQLCTVTHGAGLVLGNIDNVAVDCLELHEANIRISKPAYFSAYSELNLRSSYQSIAQLAGDTATLVVAKNQFVTLYPASMQSQPIYMAFVKSFEEIKVDALSTAVSLVLLSPAIDGAIEERAARFEFFASRFAALPDVVALADAIKLKADAGELNLQAPSADVLTLLDAALVAAAADVVASDASAAKVFVPTRNAIAHKVQVTPVNGSQNGVSLTLQQIAPDAVGNNYQLQIDNTQQRHIAVESSLLTTSIALAPGESKVQPFKSADINDVIWTVRGPGAQAAAEPVSPLLKQSVIDTAGQFYALPSLAFATGRLEAFELRLSACVDSIVLQQIRDEANAALLSSATLDSALGTPHYTAAYDEVTAPLRAAVINHLGELIECNVFRKGHWLDRHADTALVQIGTILNITQAFYAPRVDGANVLITSGLLAAGNVINTSMTEQQWTLSNRLAVTVTRTGNASPVEGTVTINQGETLQLNASCTDPGSAAPVACTVQWTTLQNTGQQGTTSGNNYSEVMNGSGSISVIATDEDGASASTTVAVTVVELPPEPPASISYWILQQGATSQRYSIEAVDVIPDTNGSDNIVQFRGFLNGTTSYPQISVSLPQFSGVGSYLLDDLASGRGFLGFAATAADQSWSTKTAEPFAVAPASGTATYSIGLQGQQIVEFDFQAVPVLCAGPELCDRQRITGHIEAP